MLNFHNLKEVRDILTHPYYVPHPAKIDLAELLEDVLELKGKKSPEEAVATLKDKIRNELKNEMKSEMKQKINKLEQLEKENKELQTKKDNAESLSRALEHAKNAAQNENTELKNRLNTQVQQLQQKNKTIEQSEERVTRIATASTGLAIGLVIYVALEHTTMLSMVAIISIAATSAFVASSATYALKSSTQVNGIQEPQKVANEGLKV